MYIDKFSSAEAKLYSTCCTLSSYLHIYFYAGGLEHTQPSHWPNSFVSCPRPGVRQFSHDMINDHQLWWMFLSKIGSWTYDGPVCSQPLINCFNYSSLLRILNTTRSCVLSSIILIWIDTFWCDVTKFVGLSSDSILISPSEICPANTIQCVQ